MTTTNLLDAAWRAAELIAQADGLIITAGAGMGVDSGLPDFRGPEGFRQAYPALGCAGMHFEDVASPHTFATDPELAWGFYGHRLALYRATVPHAGFGLLREIANRLPEGGYVFTSNVDGQFQKAGFSTGGVVEIHGSIHHLQCVHGCLGDIWPAGSLKPVVDEAHCRLTSPLPRCPHCGAVARPNILMFGDDAWVQSRTEAQQWEFRAWRANVKRSVLIELGAGTRIPSVRRFGEGQGCPLIRINKTEAGAPRPQDVSLQAGALEAVTEIAECLRQMAG